MEDIIYLAMKYNSKKLTVDSLWKEFSYKDSESADLERLYSEKTN